MEKLTIQFGHKKVRMMNHESCNKIDQCWYHVKSLFFLERRSQGLCPLTPEEVALTLRAMDFDQNTQIYIASGEIYGGQKRFAPLCNTFPPMVTSLFLLMMAT